MLLTVSLLDAFYVLCKAFLNCLVVEKVKYKQTGLI